MRFSQFFEWTGATWDLTRLTAATPTANAFMGSSVAITPGAGTVAVGAAGYDPYFGTISGGGAVYLFTTPWGGAAWTQSKLSPSVSTANIGAGVALAADGSTVIAGAPGSPSLGCAIAGLPKPPSIL